MKFKYFLRGLGTGIIFTAVVCLIAFQGSGTKNISNKEVIERAKELGMVEKEESVEDMFSSEQTGKETKEITTEKKTTEEKTTEEKTTEAKTTESTTEESQITDRETTEQTTEDNIGKTVTITIKGGATSYPVCQELQELGLIEDATDFDNYLIKNGYANRISVGTHTLKIGMSYEEIAIAISDPR